MCGKGGCAVPGAGPYLLQGGSPRRPGQREGEGPVPLRGCESSRVTTASQSGQSIRGTWIRPRGSASKEAGGSSQGRRASTDLRAPGAIREMGGAGQPSCRRASWVRAAPTRPGPCGGKMRSVRAWAGPQDLFGRAALGGAQGAP